MPISISLLAPIEGPPTLDETKIPNSEQRAFQHIVGLLRALAEYEERFRLALLLFKACDEERHRLFEGSMRAAIADGRINWQAIDLQPVADLEATVGGWQEMAARDGAISIYHFGCTVQAIHASFPKCPTLNATVDHPNLRIARKSFDGGFPRYEAIRHVVGHSAEFINSIEQRDEHSRKGPFKKTIGSVGVEIKGPKRVTQFLGNLYGNSYFVTFKGEVHGYEISQSTADRLTAIKKRIYSSIGSPGPRV